EHTPIPVLSPLSLHDALPISDRAPTADGMDRVEFLLSANAGEPLRPLARVASGGELSRIMLAFKCIEADSEGIPVLVFDEVDTRSEEHTSELQSRFDLVCRHL